MKATASLSRIMLIILSPLWLSAQKLPKIQEGSVYAPANIKIDGRLDEWNDQLQAYNIANLMYYTVSNDDENLYLTVRMKGGAGGRKVFRGGITFAISSLSNNTEDISVTYPVIKSIGMEVAWDSPLGSLFQTPSEKRYNRLYSDTVTNKKEIDDLISTHNKSIKGFLKEIQVTGIKRANGELISVYNEEGIKVAGLFNRKMEYTYELAIPLIFLEDIIKDAQCSYNIKLNASPTIRKIGDAPYRAPVKFLLPGQTAAPDPVMDYLYNTTDFSGKYTLAKKE